VSPQNRTVPWGTLADGLLRAFASQSTFSPPQVIFSFISKGFAVQTATSTSQALALLSSGAYVAVISDMARPEGPREGYVLLDAMRARGNSTPFFLCSSSVVLEEDEREIREHGGQGCLGHPSHALTMVIAVIEMPEEFGLVASSVLHR
jgi:DNA-binding response OmpR family regulator